MTQGRTSGRWRLLLVPARSGAENMARDTALMDRARETGETVFSVYSWSRPTLSLGRNQTAKGVYDPERIASRGMEVVRRPTGGRALLHHREVTYSVTAPLPSESSLRETYRRINHLLIDGLSRIGVAAHEADDTVAIRPTETLPCFAAPSEGELIAGGAKLVGSAQFRDDGALLQHGSILIDDDQGLIQDVRTGSASGSEAARAATLTEVLGRSPSVDEVAGGLFDAVREIEAPGAVFMDESDLTAATAGHLDQYRSNWWTWRR